jgi:hypothetical protein
MIMTLNFSQFMDNWPESRKDQFSYDALKAIFEHYENYEEETGDKIEFDPIAICCEWSEYPTAWDAMEQYQPDDMPVEGEAGDDLPTIQKKNEAEAFRWLSEHTTVLELDRGVVIMQF